MTIFQKHIEKNVLSDSFVFVFVWFLGEFFEYVDQYFTSDTLMELFNFILEKNNSNAVSLGYILNSLKKI